MQANKGGSKEGRPKFFHPLAALNWINKIRLKWHLFLYHLSIYFLMTNDGCLSLSKGVEW